MDTDTSTPDPGVRSVRLDADGTPVSALVSEPGPTPPRATVVALHGAGMSAGYFHGRARPDQSLLSLGTRLGFTVLAVDRPGYGASAGELPEGQGVEGQARSLGYALRDFRDRHDTGDGIFLLGHSFGGKLALAFAADHAPDDLVGLDLSGCGHRYAQTPGSTSSRPDRGDVRRNWGRLSLYPPDTFRTSGALVSRVPELELQSARVWEKTFDTLADRVRAPIRFTFAEFEAWWRHDASALADLESRLSSAPRVLIDRQPDAGHNLSLGWAARSYHLRALGFLEECLVRAGGPENATTTGTTREKVKPCP